MDTCVYILVSPNVIIKVMGLNTGLFQSNDKTAAA